MIITDAGSYTDTEIATALLQDGSRIKFVYQHLDLRNSPLRWLDSVVEGGTVDYSYFADIKMTCRLSFEEGGDTDLINFSQDRIKPYVGLRMPDGRYAYRPLGVFLMSSPQRVSGGGRVKREVLGYDQTIVLRQSKISIKLVMDSSAIIVDQIYNILVQNGISNPFVFGYGSSTHSVGGNGRAWDVGTSYYTVISDLIGMMGFASLFFDSDGRAQVREYISPSDRAVDITYKTDALSIITEDATETLDLFDVPNEWTLVRSQPDKTVLSATITNTDPKDPTSTVGRGRTITDYRSDSDSADQNTLNAAVRRIASEAAQTYRKISFTTLLNPLHGEATTVKLEHSPLGVSKIYNETIWSMRLQAGQLMRHEAREAVRIGDLPVS